MSSAAGVCLSCQFRAFLREFAPISRPWTLQRSMATAMRERKKPSRMRLSQDVAKSTDDTQHGRAKPGPFAGMNRRVANVRVPVQERAAFKAAAKTRDERPLYHALKMQQALVPLSYNHRNALKLKLEEISSFGQFDLLPEVQSAITTQALPGLEILTPTPAQRLAIPALTKKPGPNAPKKKKEDTPYDQFLIAAETGSGKTLAYLLPVIDAIKRQEALDGTEEEKRNEQEAKEKEQNRKKNPYEVEAPPLSNSPHSTTGRPRALILLPSSELVAQIGKVVKSISHAVKYRSAPISATNSPTVIRNRLFNPNGIDIIISTPYLISSIAEKEPNILSRVSHIVIDEADSLLDRSFSPTTMSIVDRAAPSLKQVILCSATIPNSLEKFLDKRYPEIKRLVTPKLHSIPRRVALGVIDIEKDPYRGNRSLACADIIWQLGRSIHDDDLATYTMKNILVFVNERDAAEEIAKFLASKGIDATALTRDTTEQRTNEILSHFTSSSRVAGDPKEDDGEKISRTGRDFVPFADSFDASSPSSSSTYEPPSPSPQSSGRSLPNTKVLVTTDLLSRGIDTLAVRHVILYDIPHTTVDFVHRLGRLGRMGRRGRAVALVGKRDRKDIVREVKEAMHRGQALI